MIQLGMTDCQPVRRLLKSGELVLDYVEVHGPFAADARAVMPTTPMLLHNSLYQWSLAHLDGLQHQKAKSLTEERLKITKTPWYSLHLGFSSAEVDFADEAMQVLSPVLPRELVLQRSCAVLNEITRQLDVPVLIENLDYNPTGAYEYVCEAQFVTDVLNQTDTFLLLDLAHAQVSAHAFKVDVKDYLHQLPLEKVRQIHVNRPGWSNARLVDSHLDMLEKDYALLEWILTETQPWAITLEYNRDESLISGQASRLRAIIEANS